MVEKPQLKQLFKSVVEKENPEAKFWYYSTSDFHIVDMPRESKLHGSSVAFKCNDQCEAMGDIITYDDPKLVKMMVDEVKKLNCKYLDTHHHGLLIPEAHIHIECKKMDLDKVKKLMDLVKWF